MARCCGDNCLCKLQAEPDQGDNDSIIIGGTGTAADPFTIGFAGLTAVDTTNINLTLSYDEAGYRVSANFGANSRLTALGDVDVPAPLNGQVPMWNDSASKWLAATPPTAPPGAVTTTTSLDGDGSAPAPLGVLLDSHSHLEDVGTGLKLDDPTINMLVQRFTDFADLLAIWTAPVLNSLAILDDAPGIVLWFDGSNWVPMVQVQDVQGTEYIQYSGGYLGSPITILTSELNTVTDDAGMFVIYEQPDLADYAGILSAHIQPTGDVPWFPMLPFGPDMTLKGFAYGPGSVDPLPSFLVTGLVTVYLY